MRTGAFNDCSFYRKERGWAGPSNLADSGTRAAPGPRAMRSVDSGPGAYEPREEVAWGVDSGRLASLVKAGFAESGPGKGRASRVSEAPAVKASEQGDLQCPALRPWACGLSQATLTSRCPGPAPQAWR